MYDELKKLRVLTDALISVDEKLEESARKWEYALNAMPNLVFVTDTDMVIKFANQAMCDVFNTDNKHFIGRYCFECVGHYNEKNLCYCAEFSEDVEDIHITEVDRWYNHNRSPVYEDGILIGYICVLNDITERKLSEDALVKSEALYKNLFNSIGDGVSIYEVVDSGEDFVFKDVNPAAEKIGRRSKEEHIGHKVTDLYPAIGSIGVFDGLKNVYKTGVQQNIPLAFYKDDRLSLWLDNYIFKLPSGEVVAVYKDVTIEIVALDTIAKRDLMLHAIYRVTPAGIGVADTNRYITWVNDKLAGMLGYRKDELEGKSVKLLYQNDEIYEKVGKEKYEQIYKNGTVSLETVWTKKDGTIIDILLTSTKMNGDNKVAFVAQDITHLKNTERDLRKDEDRLESLLRLSQLSDITEEKLINQALESCVELTDSEIGYFHFYDKDVASLNLFTWSKCTLNNCKAEKEQHYPLSIAGVWADCIREMAPVVHNNYETIINKGGLPEGHTPLKRHMSIPVFNKDHEIVAVVGVGNKKDVYNEADVRQLKLFMESLWKTISANRATKDLERIVVSLKNQHKV